MLLLLLLQYLLLAGLSIIQGKYPQVSHSVIMVPVRQISALMPEITMIFA